MTLHDAQSTFPLRDTPDGRRRRLLVGIGAAAAALGAPFVFPKSASAQPVLRISSSLPADANSSHYLWYQGFAAALRQSTGERVRLSYFPNNQLGKESDVVQQVKLGALDMMISGTSIWATAAPEFGVLDLGYLFHDFDHLGRSLDGVAGNTLTNLLKQRAGVIALGYGYSLGARNLYTRTLVRAPGDLHGLKIRVLPVPNFVSTLNLMGAVATPIPFGETYTALQTGVVDGLEQDAPTVLSAKFFEVAKHCALSRHIYNPIMPVINSRALDRFDAGLRQAILDAAHSATAQQRRQAALVEAAAFTELEKLGVTVSPIDQAALAARVSEKLWPEFIARYPSIKPVVQAIQGARA